MQSAAKARVYQQHRRSTGGDSTASDDAAAAAAGGGFWSKALGGLRGRHQQVDAGVVTLSL